MASVKNDTNFSHNLLLLTNPKFIINKLQRITIAIDYSLTPRGKTVPTGDVNKICFDDYAHTVH